MPMPVVEGVTRNFATGLRMPGAIGGPTGKVYWSDAPAGPGADARMQMVTGQLLPWEGIHRTTPLHASTRNPAGGGCAGGGQVENVSGSELTACTAPTS